ncbi:MULTISPECIES: DNA polymerase III subunit chi [unclassified Acinetobacter]|uniref:DNA polymerase III subunit chi n=1 Tax=unclassified Acinetobacter TaxID=196816 RepID=UPI0029341560|nr:MULTISPECIES: DNA polymerase III subunit chi [unclassified Acinetobacter]WOE30678.1 DNA polymerase III subunit chi [Acinetobacter sp. SAAs470]WOE38871.1 DNA polymerase III subunit chi [Acinetobacter sp. SAAs474]
MTKINFYLFEKSPERQVLATCRLCRKILRQEAQRIWLWCEDSNTQQDLDTQLWSFDPSSFIGHGIDRSQDPVCISATLPEESDWIIINFNKQPLEQFSKFSHIIEIIENHDIAKALGREKFKYYRKLGLQPKTYKL